jgi:transposase
MNVTTGTVHPKIIKRNDSDTFIEFLTELAATVDPAKKIHLILDNGSSHTSKKTRKWLREHPRFTVTYTPCHASWLNMIEIFFSILTRRMLRRGDFASREDLIEKITTFIKTYNRTAKPFRWTYDAKLLRAAYTPERLTRCCTSEASPRTAEVDGALARSVRLAACSAKGHARGGGHGIAAEQDESGDGQ